MNHPEFEAALRATGKNLADWDAAMVVEGVAARLLHEKDARIAALVEENTGSRQANRDCCAWYDALMHDHQIALKALDDLARLGNGKSYGNSTGNRIAQAALDAMID